MSKTTKTIDGASKREGGTGGFFAGIGNFLGIGNSPAGAGGGTVSGAAAGTAVAPGIGTVIGAALGSIPALFDGNCGPFSGKVDAGRLANVNAVLAAYGQPPLDECQYNKLGHEVTKVLFIEGLVMAAATAAQNQTDFRAVADFWRKGGLSSSGAKVAGATNPAELDNWLANYSSNFQESRNSEAYNSFVTTREFAAMWLAHQAFDSVFNPVSGLKINTSSWGDDTKPLPPINVDAFYNWVEVSGYQPIGPALMAKISQQQGQTPNSLVQDFLLASGQAQNRQQAEQGGIYGGARAGILGAGASATVIRSILIATAAAGAIYGIWWLIKNKS